MIRNIQYGTYFFFASFLTLAVPFVGLMVPETKGLKVEEVDDGFRHRTVWGRQRHQLPRGNYADPRSADAEKTETERAEDAKSAGFNEVERIDAS